MSDSMLMFAIREASKAKLRGTRMVAVTDPDGNVTETRDEWFDDVEKKYFDNMMEIASRLRLEEAKEHFKLTPQQFERETKGDWWCCTADYPNHDPDCEWAKLEAQEGR